MSAGKMIRPRDALARVEAAVEVVDGKVTRLITEDYKVTQAGPEVVDVDNVALFEFGLFAKHGGPIPVADITAAGTYDITRFRAGTSTAIVTGGTFTAADGRVYMEHAFATADWARDDCAVVEPQQDTRFDLGGEEKAPFLPSFVLYVTDASGMKDKITAIYDETTTSNLAVDAGARTDSTRLGRLVRYAVDHMESTTLDAGDGSRANTTRLGSLVRWLADQLFATDAEVETTTLAVGAGSNATTTRSGALIRWLTDNAATAAGVTDVMNEVESTTLDAGGGSRADTTRLGSLMRWAADGIHDIQARIGDMAGHTLTTLTAKFGDDPKTVKDRFDDVDTATTALDADLAKVPKSDGSVTWNSTALGSINAECDTALADIDADHLTKTALPTDPATDIAADSTVGHIMGKADMSTYDRATDSQEAISEALVVVDGLHDVPVEDSADDIHMRDVVGKKSDTVAGTSVISSLKRIEGHTETATVRAGGTETMTALEADVVEITDTVPWLMAGGSLNLSPMEAGDTIIVRVYKKNAVGGAYVQVGTDADGTYNDVQAVGEKLVTFRPETHQTGWKVTMVQTATGAGGLKDIDYEVFHAGGTVT